MRSTVNTVRSHLSARGLPRYECKVKRPTKLAPFEAYLRERHHAAHSHWIPATLLMREIVARRYTGGSSQLRAFMRTLRPVPSADPVVHFETPSGEQMQIDWVEFRKGADPLYAFNNKRIFQSAADHRPPRSTGHGQHRGTR